MTGSTKSAAPAPAPRPSEEAIERPASQKGALAALSLAMLMPSLATSIANAALPVLAKQFAASFQGAQWIILAYLLTTTAALVVGGRLGDLAGRRRLLLAGIALFTFASLLCAAAPTLPLLVAARAVQGLGAALMMALAVALLGDVVPKARMGRAMGLLGTMSAVGTTLGPSLGGILLAKADWPSIFLLNLPLGLLAFMLAWRSLPADSRAAATERGMDGAGVALLLLALGAYALAMTIGRGDFGPLNLGLLLIALFAGGVFVRVEANAASPLVRLSLFRDPVLRTGLATSALISTVMMATLVVGPFYLSGGLGLDTATVGIALSAGPFVAAVTGIPAGRLTDRFGVDRMTIAGLFAMMAGSAVLCLLPLSLGVAGYVLPIILMTSGYAIFQAANNSAVMANAPDEQRGLLSAMLALSRNLGLVTGASAMGAVFAFGVDAEVVAAAPDAIAAGMRLTFLVASLLIALAMARAIRRRSVSAGVEGCASMT